MFTRAKIYNGDTYLKNHLRANDYYSKGERVTGEWVGIGAEKLGLRGEVTPEQFEALRTNHHPVSGEQLTPRTKETRVALTREAGDDFRKKHHRQGTDTEVEAHRLKMGPQPNRVAFYDFQCSAQKSVSIMGVLAGDDRLREAHEWASRVGLKELEKFAARQTNTAMTRGSELTGNLCGAAFTHDASRALDPQLHTHFVLANATQTNSGKWFALHENGMLEAVRYAGKVYQNELAREVKALGYEVREVREKGEIKGFEIKGVSQELCERFAKRREEIEKKIDQFEKDNGREPTRAEVSAITRQTRPSELKEISTAEVRKFQFGQLSSEEWSQLQKVHAEARQRVKQGVSTTAGQEKPALKAAVDHLFERQSVLKRHDILAEALNQKLGSLDLAKLTAQVEAGKAGLIRLADDPVQPLRSEHATRDGLKGELWSVNFVNKTKGAFPALNPRFEPQGKLSPEQRDAVKHILAANAIASPLLSLVLTFVLGALPYLHSPFDRCDLETETMARDKSSSNGNGATLGFEAKLWLTADKLRNNMDAAEYKHVVLGLIFLKYISDAFEEMRIKLTEGKGEHAGADPEDQDEYVAHNVFWVPPAARWSYLQNSAKQPTIGKVVDDAMVALERDNPRLKGVLPKDYARPGLDKHRLGELIDLIGTIGLGDAANRSKDILGRVYEYFLTMFASAEGKNGGQFYTPSCIVRLIVAMLSPIKGRVYDPACGSGGMFVQSEKFVEEHGGHLGDISIFGQESNATTRRLAIMNLAIRGIEADFGPEHADTFRRDLHKDLKAQFVFSNPPFNDSDWHRVDDDVRWKFGVPPQGNANFAWVQHFIHHLAPDGYAGFVLANGSMSSNQSGEGDIRRALIEADLVDCMVALPGQLFYSTQIPVCLWFVAKNKNNGKRRDRRRQTLFIDARKLGTMIDRVHRELTEADIAKIVSTYHSWRGDEDGGKYTDTPGFCKSATTDEIATQGHVLTPGRYVGAEEIEDSGEPFEEKMPRLVAALEKQFAESSQLESEIRKNLKVLGL